MIACSANPLDPGEKGCIEIRGIGNTCDNAEDSSDSECQTACTNADDCVGLEKLGYNSVDACATACRLGAIPGEKVECFVDAGQNCGVASACLTGGDTQLCDSACNTIDQCTDGGLAGAGLTMNDCKAGCGLGQVGSQRKVECIAQAQSCDEANDCN